MAQVFWIIAYAIMGFGAYWLVAKQEDYYKLDLFKRFEETGYLAVTKYMERKYLWAPKKVNGFTVCIAFIVSALVWAAWPMVVIVVAIWNVIDYKVTLNEGTKVINK